MFGFKNVKLERNADDLGSEFWGVNFLGRGPEALENQGLKFAKKFAGETR